MEYLKFGVVCLCAFSLSGCFVSESKHQESVANLNSQIQLLKNNLGEFQYLSIDPEVVVSVKDVTFKKPKSEYSSPTVKFRVSLKQTNKNFPLNDYNIGLFFHVLDENGNKVAEIRVQSEMENGVLSLAEEKTLFELKSSKFIGYKLKIKNLTWFPILRFQAKASESIS